MKSKFIFSLSLIVLAASCSEKPQQEVETKKQAVEEEATAAPEGMVYLKGGTYKRGSEGRQDNGTIYHEESPAHDVTISPFFIDCLIMIFAQCIIIACNIKCISKMIRLITNNLNISRL